MSTSFPFEYEETFTQRTLERMPDTLHINGQDNPTILLIIRLLSGSLKLRHVKTSKLITQKDNYFSADLNRFNQQWDRHFPELIADEYNSQQLAVFLEATKHRNKLFYRNILSELSYFFYYQSKGNHSSAFIFLYRTLEHVSYAFPLIYTSRTDDFTKTYGFLKQLMNKEKAANAAGELAFFKSFVRTIYKDDSIYESSVDFPISIETESEQQAVFTLLRNLCSDEMLADATESPRVLSIKYPEVVSFFITVRNRFFHFQNGNSENIESSKIHDIDGLFSIINKKILYWLSSVLLAVISHTAIEFEDLKARIG